MAALGAYLWVIHSQKLPLSQPAILVCLSVVFAQPRRLGFSGLLLWCGGLVAWSWMGAMASSDPGPALQGAWDYFPVTMSGTRWRGSKARLQQALYRAAGNSGLNDRIGRSNWRRDRLLILCYHGFSRRDEHLWNPELYITPGTFRRRLEILDRVGAHILPLDTALAGLAAGSLPSSAVVITVDDGALDFLLMAYPIIQEFRVPVTLYVSTYYVFKQLPVFDVFARYLLWNARDSGRLLAGSDWPLKPLVLNGGTHWRSAGLQLRQYTMQRHLSADEKQTLLVGLAGALGVDLGDYLRMKFFHLMAADDLSALDPALVDLQLHTHRHRMPSDPALLRRELEDNRLALERTGRRAHELVHFCYPNGACQPSDPPILLSAGIVSATTGVPGLASRRSEPLLLPRFVDSEGVSEAAFRAWVSGAGPWFSRRRPL